MHGTHDILGHSSVVDRLWRAMEADGLHHAYLFEGPDGVGKRLVALRLAMAVNCTSDLVATERPCGTCDSCTQIAAGTHPDVLIVEPEPDRATPIITVAQVRELIRKVGYHRYKGRRRIIIVDPAESMPAPSANALLKTLEEPPEGTGIILLASHPASLLPTIISRCQRVRFTAVPEAELVAWLQQRDLEPAIPLARIAMGRPGVALELAGGALDSRRELRATVLDLVRHGNLGRIFDFSKATCTGGRADWAPKAEAVLNIIEDLLRDATVAGAGGGVPLFDPEVAQSTEGLAGRLWPMGIHRCAVALEDARAALAANVSGRTVLDALICRVAAEAGQLS